MGEGFMFHKSDVARGRPERKPVKKVTVELLIAEDNNATFMGSVAALTIFLMKRFKLSKDEVKEDFNITRVKDGDGLLKQLEKNDGYFDIIIVDDLMPTTPNEQGVREGIQFGSEAIYKRRVLEEYDNTLKEYMIFGCSATKVNFNNDENDEPRKALISRPSIKVDGIEIKNSIVDGIIKKPMTPGQLELNKVFIRAIEKAQDALYFSDEELPDKKDKKKDKVSSIEKHSVFARPSNLSDSAPTDRLTPPFTPTVDKKSK
jgi:hypothetical protein